jgi:heme o synthase
LIKAYLSLTKPGIIFGNLITAAAGFFLASKGHIHFGLFLAVLLGISFVIASACVVNNYIDRGIDKKMARTRNRALVAGVISGRNALLYAAALGIAGFLILTFFTNFLTVFLGFIAFFVYVVLYGIWKRRSIHGTIIGSISGALPPVAGYCAVTNRIDTGAVILFIILVAWQMPHFYAIALYRLHDYTAALLPVLPVKKSIFVTKVHILFYIIIFIIAAFLLTALRFTGYIYLVITAIFSFAWLGFAIKGFRTNNTTHWARKMFLFSLAIIIELCIMVSVDVAIIPRS